MFTDHENLTYIFDPYASHLWINRHIDKKTSEMGPEAVLIQVPDCFYTRREQLMGWYFYMIVVKTTNTSCTHFKACHSVFPNRQGSSYTGLANDVWAKNDPYSRVIDASRQNEGEGERSVGWTGVECRSWMTDWFGSERLLQDTPDGMYMEERRLIWQIRKSTLLWNIWMRMWWYIRRFMYSLSCYRLWGEHWGVDRQIIGTDFARS